MKFLRVLTTDDVTEYISMDKILNITPYDDKVKILLGAGLFWWAWRDSLAVIDMADIITGEDQL